jgi:hypothetical protein
MVTSGSIEELERGMLDEKKLILFFVAFNAAFLDMDRRAEDIIIMPPPPPCLLI